MRKFYEFEQYLIIDEFSTVMIDDDDQEVPYFYHYYIKEVNGDYVGDLVVQQKDEISSVSINVDVEQIDTENLENIIEDFVFQCDLRNIKGCDEDSVVVIFNGDYNTMVICDLLQLKPSTILFRR